MSRLVLLLGLLVVACDRGEPPRDGPAAAPVREPSPSPSGRELDAFRRAATSFFDARSRSEVDHEGGGAARAIDDPRLAEAIAGALERLRGPGFPGEARDPAALEAELEKTYLRLLACPRYAPGVARPGGITQNGIRDTQRLWITYRDAFVALAARERAEVSGESARAFVVKERTAMLVALATGCGD